MAIETRSLWADVDTLSSHSPVAASYDVCVIGAGIAGLTTAYSLLKEGARVGILESQSHVASGESLFTTAHLASIIDDRFHRLISIRGAENARLAHQSHAAAIDAIERIVKDEAIDCDFERLDGFLFAGNAADTQSIDEEEKAARELMVPHERLQVVPGIVKRECLRFPHQGQFHPTKYLAGLARAVEAAGGVFHTDTRVIDVEGGDRITVTTQDKHSIKARNVVIATNMPINAGMVLSSKLAAYTTYAFAAPIVRSNFPAGLYWDTLDPYHYVRKQTMTTLMGTTDFLIVGGEDHRTGQADDTVARWDRLERWARETLKDVELGEVSHRWSGQVFETLDGLGLIGAQPGGPANVYIATGDSGMGITHGTIAGLMLPQMILGRGHPWTDLYDPRRVTVSAAKTFVEENASTIAPYRDYLTSGDTTLEQMRPGQGAIVRQGMKKLAVHCDGEGHCHAMSAKCPHLGGLVRWNEAEGTWDCPVHGSRFSADGKVIHGPAVDDLQPVEIHETVSK